MDPRTDSAHPSRNEARQRRHAPVATQLSLSPRTLETYRSRAMEKLRFKTRADLVRYAVNCGWLGAR